MRGAALGLFVLALTVRLAHNSFILNDPLYYHPVGGHMPYFTIAEQIAENRLDDQIGLYRFSSPSYPYLIAGLYKLVGTGNYLGLRLVSSLADSWTCVLVSLLAFQFSGIFAAVATGIIYALLSPAVFYAAELTPIPYVLLLLTLSIGLLARKTAGYFLVLAGLCLGIAITLRPNLLLAVPLLLPFAFFQSQLTWPKAFALFLAGVALPILPLAVANYQSANSVIPISATAGHNFYIGHNTAAATGYRLPHQFDGVIFDEMKGLAEKVEDRTMQDAEVSAYYFKKALRHIIGHPAQEAQLLLSRARAFLGRGEATTYANFYYQSEYSPILRMLPGFGLLIPLGLTGLLLASSRKTYILSVPILVSFLTVILFFFITRLRIPAAPFLAIFSGLILSQIWTYIKDTNWRKATLPLFTIAILLVVSNIQQPAKDTSNEWNKAGVLLELTKRLDEAEHAYLRAAKANPANVHSHRNLARLYITLGEDDKADKHRKRAVQIEAHSNNAEAFESELLGDGL